MGYDGANLIAEYASNGSTVLRKYVHGPGTDDPILWYEGSGTGDKRYMHKDERGSVVALTNASGGLVGINAYDDFGIPAATNIGRFQYTGQTWLSDLGLYYYKARIYSPTLGRFLQTDPIGYGDGMNLYAYVGNDPINATDPTGLWINKSVIPKQGYSYNSIGGAFGGRSFDFTCVTGTSTLIGFNSTSSTTECFGGITFGGGSPFANPQRPTGESDGGSEGQETEDGNGCNQRVLNAFKKVSKFGKNLDNTGNGLLVIAGGIAVTSAAVTATGVGAPAGIAGEGVAGTFAIGGLTAKVFGGGTKLIGDIGAAVQTGNTNATGSLIARGVIGILPGGNGLANNIISAVTGEAAESLLPSSESPNNCPTD